ncbi:HPr family phosphocarrier protein [bacterium]|nr:HPr family phosphocarrier protein [bacterium]MBR5945689.1 HPr family phosphocarrier protein [bacterium]MBR6462568.1 HPr family phosphocarrier protein [bacterium]
MATEDQTLERTLEVLNYQGVHARPAALIVKVATQYKAELTVCRKDDEDEEVNAKSIMGLMMLAAGQGTELLFRAKGEDAAELLDALEALFKANFNE